MKLTPRKNEVAAIVELLEKDGYETAEALAKDVIKKVAELFSEREFYALAWREGPTGLSLCWGPLTSDNEVTKFGEKLALGGQAVSVKLGSVASMLECQASAEEGLSKLCTTCHHPHGTHRHEGKLGQCMVRGCKCKYDSTK